MTTSRETDNLDLDAIRQLMHEAQSLPLRDRLTFLKGLVPTIAREMSPKEFEALIVELRLKGERYYDAASHPGQGRAERNVIGERELEARG